MQSKAIAVAAVVGAAALGWSALPANAATQCFRENVMRPGGFHEIVQRCETRHIVPPAPRTVTRTRTITRDYYVTEPSYTTTYTRDYYYTRPVPRAWDEDVYYGSSLAPPAYYDWGY